MRTTEPVRHFTVRLTLDSAEFSPATRAATADLELPAEAFCRLVYGRLDPDHTPVVEANAEVLEIAAAGLPRTLTEPTSWTASETSAPLVKARRPAAGRDPGGGWAPEKDRRGLECVRHRDVRPPSPNPLIKPVHAPRPF